MCPLRVILLFLSAMLAGYFAFKSVQSDGDSSVLNFSEEEEQVVEETSLLTKVSTGISSGFWVMIDMLSGRYLYQNLKGQAQAKGDAFLNKKGCDLFLEKINPPRADDALRELLDRIGSFLGRTAKLPEKGSYDT